MGVTLEVFLGAVEALGLPVTSEPLAVNLDQPVRWRSVHRARLIAALQEHCEARPDIKAVFAATTAAEIFELYTCSPS